MRDEGGLGGALNETNSRIHDERLIFNSSQILGSIPGGCGGGLDMTEPLNKYVEFFQSEHGSILEQ